MANSYQKYTCFKNNLLILGFGTIGQAILPLISRHIDIKPEQIKIITKKAEGKNIAHQFNVAMEIATLTKENYQGILNSYLKEGDFLLNLSVDISSADLIQYCQNKNVLYLDTCIEPWAGGYVDSTLPPSTRSNYALREKVLALRKTNPNSRTALIAHGANPGLVSHFVKQALLNIAKDNGYNSSTPRNQTQWGELAQNLGIKVIHIAERDTQKANNLKHPHEFVNTWSIDGFISELSQPVELGWGSHEKHWPNDAAHHNFGSQCAIYLNRPGASQRVRTWTPLSGPFHAFLITHTESISIANYLTLKKENHVHYRPTVHFAYHPCEDAVLSLYEFAGREWKQHPEQRIMFDEIIEGMDELGVLLMGNQKGAYWFGSQLSIQETRKLVPYNNATSLQVAIGALSGMIWVINHPEKGIIEPDEIDFRYIMNIAEPYLGKVSGFYTDWTPLDEREKLFPEKIDKEDPWQFLNIQVN